MHSVLLCTRGPASQPFDALEVLGYQPVGVVPGVQVPEFQPPNFLVSQDSRSQPLAVPEVTSLQYLGRLQALYTGPPTLAVTSLTLVTRTAHASLLTHRPYSLLSTPRDCGFWTWQPGPPHGLSGLGPQHACCLHRQLLFLPYFCC